MATKGVVGLGLCVIDHLFRVENLDLAETRTRYVERRVGSGGMVGTAVSQSAQLGCPSEVLSLVGNDPDGRLIRRTLRAAGVRTQRLILSDEFPTTVAVVLVDRRNGDRKFLVPDRRELEKQAPQFDLASIHRGTLLLVDGHFPEQALRAVKRARECGATVVADLSSPRPANLRLLPYVDYPIVPREFIDRCGETDPRRALRVLHERYGGTPVVTLGRRGGMVLLDGKIVRYRAHPARVVDTTGAGDVFHGAFVAGLYHDLDVPSALDLAARAAARACSVFGGNLRLMTRSQARIGRGKKSRR